VIWNTTLLDVLGDENPLKVRASPEELKTGAITEMPRTAVFVRSGIRRQPNWSP